MKAAASPRKRNAAATREAILQAARKAFADAGYDGAGLREIATMAGVTAMMVSHYFGSKEQLFTEVLADRMRSPDIVRQDIVSSRALARDLAKALVARTSADAAPLDGFRILLKSLSNQRATQLGREQIEQFHHRNLRGVMEGEHVGERAALILSMLAGFQLMRQMFGLRAFADTDPQVLVELLVPIFDLLVGGERWGASDVDEI